MKRSIAWLVLVLLLCPIAAYAQPTLPALETDGFLPKGAAPYVYADREEGQWVFVDQTLRVEIIRKREGTPVVEWFESVVRCKGDTTLHTLFSAKTDPPSKYCIVAELAQRANVVFAINDDYFGGRQAKKKATGIILRDGEVLGTRTLRSNTSGWPPLEVLARFKDGSLKVFDSMEHTAEEYLAMGVLDTYAFGPMLVRDGKIVDYKSILTDVNGTLPRCALGMVAPNHYVVLTVPGNRIDSVGVSVQWMAEKMHALGAVEALNLDGGNTTSLCFLGDLLTRPETGGKGQRSMTSIIAIGQVPDALMIKP